MGKRSKRKRSGTTRRAKRRRRSSQGISGWVWVGGVATLLLGIILLNLWRSGAFAGPLVPSRSEEVTDLLPLTEAGSPLQGGHDMARIPQQTPVPQVAPVDMPVPVLDLPSTSYDFGRIPSRPENVAHVFAVQNTGNADLMIGNLVTSCGCTTAELSSSVISPGRRADLTVIFDPDFHPTQGPVTRLVWFATNDPTQPWVEVRILADVEP